MSDEKKAEKRYFDFDGDTVTVPLLRPFEFDGIKHSSISLRELTVEDNLELDKKASARSSYEQDIHYFAKMAGKPAAMIQQLRERDWKRLKNAYWETLGNVELEPPSSE